ncbi:testisin-like [Ctenocephalides felis]|uniref:testisin-like n=1 Tax=Ctenocephalides felis TaxID=7515 RepID=UPI000E6E348B|nr:testisin-like [Ctenocephalides felis]
MSRNAICLPQCPSDIAPPPSPPFTRAHNEKLDEVLGHTRVRTCNNGNYFGAEMKLTCTELKSDTLDIQCQRGFRSVPCTSRMQPGTRANLACKPGFQLHKEPEFSQINCGNDGIWDNCLFSCEPECGNPTPIETVFNSDPPVTYLAGQYPWYAMLFTRREDLFKGQFLFSSAYCAHKDIYAQHYEIEKVIVPKGFDIKKEGNPNNIAIILVKGKFTFSDIIKPICLERHFNGPIEEPEGEIGYVPGYSTDRQTLDTVRFVYNVSLAYISNTSCRNFEYPFKRFYQSYDKFCAGNLSFGYEIPFGFLGGGYFVPDYKSFEPVYFLKGVASAYGRSVNFLA